ncbi:MAG: TonB-dependent receptor [Myxococcaceae bacterium]|nr:TonB-dependent receptor [Myxococcaceae bacterium]
MPRLLPFTCLAAVLLAHLAQAQEAYDGVSRRKEVPDASVPVMTRPPELLQSVPPEFPEQAREAGASGEVTLRLTIGPTGKVEQAEVVGPAGNGFDEAAVAAALQFVFRPAEIDGKPGAVQIEYTQHFTWAAPAEAVDAGPPPPPMAVLSGQLLQKGNRHPIPAAMVQVADGGVAVESDAEGRFTLEAPAGEVTITAQGSSHLPFEATETLVAGERLEVKYYLAPKSIGLYETTVHGERERTEVSRVTLKREELTKVPGAFGDPLRVLQSLPGVARAPFGLGLLLVRGSSPNDTGVYFDGIQLPLLYHFGGGPSVVNPELVDRIDFYPGGFGAEYGRAIGGLVDVAPRDVALDGLVHASAKVDLIDAAAYLSVPILPGLSVSVSGRRSYIDALLGLVLRGTTLVSPAYYDYQGKLDYRPPGSKHAVGLFVFGSFDELKVVIGRGSTTSAEINTQQGFLRVEGYWSYRDDRATNKLQLFGGTNNTSFGISVLRFDGNDVVAGLRERFDYRIDDHFTFRGGLDVTMTRASQQSYFPRPADYRTFPGEQPVPELVTQSAEHEIFAYAEWAELQLKAGPLKLIPGLRAEQYRLDGNWKTGFHPRLTTRLDFGEENHRFSVKGSIGLYQQNPSAQLLAANPKLELEQAFQASLGAEWDVTTDINIDVTGFYNRRFDLGQRVNQVTTQDDGTVTRLLADNVGLGRAYGLEVFIRRKITEHFFGWLAYTLSWSEERRHGDSTYHWSAFDQRHILSAVAQYKFGNGWEVGARFRLTTGTPSTPIIDATFDADTESYRPINGEAGSVRLGTFHQLDVRVDKTWLFSKWSLGVYVDIQNVYNATNAEFLTNDYRYRTQGIVAGLPFLPVIGIKGTY